MVVNVDIKVEAKLSKESLMVNYIDTPDQVGTKGTRKGVGSNDGIRCTYLRLRKKKQKTNKKYNHPNTRGIKTTIK